jgi:hypothetical protein
MSHRNQRVKMHIAGACCFEDAACCRKALINMCIRLAVQSDYREPSSQQAVSTEAADTEAR